MSDPKFPPMPSYLGPSDGATTAKILPGTVAVATLTFEPPIDWKVRAETAEARVAELEAFVRPFAESGHDIECDCDRGPCTCSVGPAQQLIPGERDTDSVSHEQETK